MKRRPLRRPAFRLHKPRLEQLEERAVLATAWSTFAGNAQHTSISSVTSQAMESVHWSTPVDNFPTSRAAHYGGPLITLNNTVIYPYKTGNTQATNTPDFRVVARSGVDGSLLWDVPTPYVPASYSWYPGYQPVLATATDRVYFAGKGGTIYYRDNPDSASGTVTQLAFFGSMAHYQANQATYDNNVYIDTPLTADNQGNIYFGFRVTGSTPTNLVSGIAKISFNGTVTTSAGIWVSATAAANDPAINSVQQNGAPAISTDGLTLYIAVKGNGEGPAYGRLLGLSTANLSTQFDSGILKDPRGSNAVVLNISTSSPVVAPDGRVFLGVFGNPYNGSRGWMLQFSGDLQTKYAAGGFGWDTTPSIIPASLLGSQYSGTSSYLIFTKYNNYYFPNGANDGGDGQNAIAILDPNATEVEFHHPEQNIQVMRRVLFKVGPTADWDYPNVPTAVREWCINYGAVDVEKKSVIVNSSDGFFYRWNLETNTLTEPVQLTSGIGQPYTMTVIGVDGTLYGIQMGRLFALGETPKMSIGDVQFTEGNAGTTNAVFTVSLNYTRRELITVNWATADGTATAGADYLAASGTLLFDPGERTKTITVALNGDTLDEPNENFFINLTGAGNANLVDGQAIATIVDDDAQPNLAVADVSINEGNSGTTNMVFPIRLNTASGQSVTVDWATSNGTASSASDYLAANGTVTFAPGETEKLVLVQVQGDSTFENNETLFLNLSNATNATISDNRGTGTITNDDGVPSLSVNDAVTTEGSSLVFTVSLSNPSSQTITVAYTTADGTATSGDYTTRAASLSFSPGVTSRTVTVNTTNDSLSEATEQLFLRLSSPNNAFIADSEGEGSIQDNDPLPTLSINSVSQDEGSSGTTSFLLTVSLNTASGQVVTVDYATADGQATLADNDYVANSGTLTFAPGETSKSITLLVTGDERTEALETFFVNLSNPTAATLGNASGTVSIIDDDALRFSVSDIQKSEGTAATTTFDFVVSLSSPAIDPIRVDYTTADGTATVASGDFVAKSGTLTFAAGVLTQIVSVTVNNDALNEATERFYLQLSNPVGGVLFDPVGQADILDNDAMPNIIINDFSEPELNYNQAPFIVYVSLSAPSGQTVKVDFRTENGTATSTSNIKDYIDTLGTLEFAPGEVTKSFPVTIVGDIRHEDDETLRVILSNPVNVALPDTESIITIANDDQAYVTIAGKTVTEPNSGFLSGTVLVELSLPSDKVITIDYVTSDLTATAGSDYVALSGTLTFQPSEQSKSITFQVKGDTIHELNEAFEIELTGQTGGATLPDYAEADIEILDNDIAGFAVQDTSILEGNSGQKMLVIPINLSRPADRTLTVQYATSDFSATAGSDYLARSGTLTFLAGETSKSISVPVIGDVQDEANDRFKITLSNPSGGVLSRAVGYGTITNDDVPGFSIADARIVEGTGGTRNVLAKVSLTRPAVTPVSVQVATSNGTATAGLDYTAINTTLNFAIGVASQTVTIPIVTDSIDELDENFTITLSNPTGQSAIEDATAIVTLTDDDQASFSIGDVTVTEGDSGTSTATFTVKLSKPSSRTTTVRFATAADTATTADFTSQTGTLTFAPLELTKTITVQVKGDELDEDTELFYVNLSLPTGEALIADGVAKGTIADNDTARLSVADLMIAEPTSSTGNAAITVFLSNPSTKTITVAYTTLNSTAVSPADFTAVSGTLTFAPGQTSQTVLVPLKGDLIDEADEFFSLRLSASTNASILDSTGVVTIVDNDTSRISIANVSQLEGNSGISSFVFLVTLSNPNSRVVTVNYATANGTATVAGSDYVAKTGAISFSAGQTSRMITVGVRGDRLAEANETFFLNLTSPVNATILDAQGIGTIRNDDTAAASRPRGEGEGEGESFFASPQPNASLSLRDYLERKQSSSAYGPSHDSIATIDLLLASENWASDDWASDDWISQRRKVRS